jgi:hypothetical protein
MDASDPIKPEKTLVARGPSTYGSRLKADEVSIEPAKASAAAPFLMA